MPILYYIADFMCRELKLIIEIDGVTHEFKRVADDVRDNKLNEIGYSIIGFSDIGVMENIEGVERSIKDWIISSPYPLQRGTNTRY